VRLSGDFEDHWEHSRGERAEIDFVDVFEQ
jgi:hypothetical protein